MNRRAAVVAVGLAAVAATVVGLALYLFPVSPKVEVRAGPVLQNRPITDVRCGQTYQFTHLERFYVDGRVAVNFYFGGNDRNLQPQYIWDENVLGQPTEIRKARRVVPSLTYSEVTFVCQSDPPLEGHKISNVELMRYRMTLRRPLRPQHVIRPGGPARR